MDVDTWAQIAVLSTGATICGVLLHAIGKLSTKIDAMHDDLRTEFKTDIGKLSTKVDTTREDLRSEFKTDIGKLTTIVLRLDERVYDLATGNRARPLIVPPH